MRAPRDPAAHPRRRVRLRLPEPPRASAPPSSRAPTARRPAAACPPNRRLVGSYSIVISHDKLISDRVAPNRECRDRFDILPIANVVIELLSIANVVIGLIFSQSQIS